MLIVGILFRPPTAIVSMKSLICSKKTGKGLETGATTLANSDRTNQSTSIQTLSSVINKVTGHRH